MTPLPIDLAIDSFWGDARRGGLWADLIRSGRVAGAHFGPPCETYTDARWLEVIGEVGEETPETCQNFGVWVGPSWLVTQGAEAAGHRESFDVALHRVHDAHRCFWW